MKVDTRKRAKFMISVRKGNIILHSPRGSNIAVKPEEVDEVIELLSKHKS